MYNKIIVVLYQCLGSKIIWRRQNIYNISFLGMEDIGDIEDVWQQKIKMVVEKK